MKRLLAAGFTALALFGTAACSDDEPASSPAPGQLSDVQHTLDSIEQDMAGDPAP
ncbi:hypothetical protein [Amycolatopsis sp. EV170708-02-1]|uniref:hypothetical protein n=1 Tax=Amycolatopsis sp. EV170708-02-1 TaxID=2919322 RepID=UPI001F0BF6C1|nr:hypothetical protein [Amycolatopsis sp. EV170708-02-1]UMP07156.1 hypothetical protein MJQ72_21110 [Amycolatopsis sp. EV170708-02-1]